jgi:hypothetical protein
MRLSMPLDLRNQVEGSIMFSKKLVTQLARTFTHRLWLLVLPLAMLNAACSGLTTSTSKPPTGDTTPPTVSITSPASGATVSGAITVTANASDNVAVASVQFQVDGSNFGTLDTSAPYSASLSTTTLTNGKHSLTAVAIDTAGNKATSAAVSVTVNNTGDTTPPTVSITSPASGVTVSGTITVTANASDNVAVASVQFQVDGSNLGAAVTSTPYSVSLNTTTLTNAAHTLTAIATDTSNNKTTSAGVSITVNNTNSTPVTVSIISPVLGATVSGTVSVTANASAGAGVASVQFLLDGANLGSPDTSSPYAVSWNTTTASNGSHTLAAKATDKSGNTATSGTVTVNVSQSTPPPPPPVGDEATITDGSGLGQTNRPISISRPFVQGEIANFAQASIGGTALPTQCDVKNRWPDGSLKFAVVSFVIPSIAANGSVVVSFSNQASGNTTGYLAQSDMLNSSYNFDGQIQLAGTASHNISARAILSAAGSCKDPGNDPDSGQFVCTYWLKGPIVTAVILEDRAGRSFDVNTDKGTGNPLHPIFEAWFYPQGNLVQLGYTLENSWASTNPTNSARDQVYSVVLTGGNANPATEFTNGSLKQLTRTRWHKTFCVNGAGAGNANGCGPLLHIDHNWGYLAETKFTPHWDPTLQISTSKIASEARLLTNAAALNLGGCSSCVEGGPGIGSFQQSLDAGGTSEWHGPLTTWDIIYLMSQCDTGNSTSATCGNGSAGDMYSVMLTNADLGGMIPYFFREADASAGHGQFFDAPNNTVATQGRVVSINARTQISLYDVTGTQNQCNADYAADWINYGGSGQDFGNWADQQDTSHWPNLAYASYLTTGQYAYYEEQVMQAAYAIGASPGTRACVSSATSASSRQGAVGYWGTDQERQAAWLARENALGAFIALDGSPEKAYLTDKLLGNLAVWEGSHGIPCDIPGTGVQLAYCGATGSYYHEGTSVRIGVPWSGTPLGSWTDAVCSGGQNCYVPNAPLCQTGSGCTVPASANSNFQNDYSGLVIGWINDLGYCPGSCQMLQFVENWFINVVLDPNSTAGIFGSYVYPTLNGSSGPITSFSQFSQFYAAGSWPPAGLSTNANCGDEPYSGEGVAVLSYGYTMTSNEGYTGSAAWNSARPQLLAGCASNNVTFQGPNGTPKWDITPRQ